MAANGELGRGRGRGQGRGGGGRLEEEYRRVFPLTRQRDGRRPLERRRARSHRAWWRAGERSVPQDTGAHTRIRLSRRTRARARASFYLSLPLRLPFRVLSRPLCRREWSPRSRTRFESARTPVHRRHLVPVFELSMGKEGPAVACAGERREPTPLDNAGASRYVGEAKAFFSSRASGCHSHG